MHVGRINTSLQFVVNNLPQADAESSLCILVLLHTVLCSNHLRCLVMWVCVIPSQQVPETALNVTLQEDKYHRQIQDLSSMLTAYAGAVSSLTFVETALLRKQLGALQVALKPGFTPLNWNSQRIPSFIESCNKAVGEFVGVVSQIHKSSAMIDEVRAVLLREFPVELIPARVVLGVRLIDHIECSYVC